MSYSTDVIEPVLASSMRVSRNYISLQDLLAIYPSLTEKSLLPLSLTDSERRLLLDLPDQDVETANIEATTNLPRDQLIAKANIDAASLTQQEIALLKNRFWSPPTAEETARSYTSLGVQAMEGLLAARQAAYLPGEQEGLSSALKEHNRRAIAMREAPRLAEARQVMPYVQNWTRQIYEREKEKWGYVCLYDGAAQAQEPERLDSFAARWDMILWRARASNASTKIIDLKWSCLTFDAPETASVPHDGATFRRAFQDILKHPRACGHSKSINEAGILTNTFLVYDPVCITSAHGSLCEDMRILAFEADYPVAGRTYFEGYAGYTWVRLDALVFRFYETRLMHPEIGMDEIWKAAQGSRHEAFVSMDPEEAKNWAQSGLISGYEPESVLGRERERVLAAVKEGERVPAEANG